MSDNARPQAVQAVLFDLDGVLVHSYDAWFELFNDTLEHFKFPRITEAVFRRHWGQSTEEDVRIFMPGRTVDEVRGFFLGNFRSYLQHIACDPDAVPVLKELRDHGLLLGCVTNSHRDITTAVLRRHAMEDLFHVVLTADDVVCPKPAPEILFTACKQLDVPPCSTLFIGDTHTDIEAGQNAGCIMIGYRIVHSQCVQDLKQLRDMISSEYL